VTAISQNTRTEALAAPKLLTSDGVQASVSLGKRYYFPESWDTAEVEVETSDGSSSVTITPPQPEFNKDGEVLGINFSATPVVQPDNYTIRLQLNPNLSEYVAQDSFDVVIYGHMVENGQNAGAKNYVYPVWRPVVATRSMSVTVDVYDGETVILGGMIDNQISTRTDKIPILGDLPLLGRFFQSQSENAVKKNLLLFVTARLVDYSGVPVSRGKNTAQPDFKR
jgi:general secretion pathway protein D